MLVAEAMTPGPVTLAPEATVAAARSAMRRGRFRHLPVVAGAELVGVVAGRDLEVWPGAPAEAAESLADRPLTEVMSTDPVTVWPDVSGPGRFAAVIAARSSTLSGRPSSSIFLTCGASN